MSFATQVGIISICVYDTITQRTEIVVEMDRRLDSSPELLWLMNKRGFVGHSLLMSWQKLDLPSLVSSRSPDHPRQSIEIYGIASREQRSMIQVS